MSSFLNPAKHKSLIVEEALRLGFSHVGISKAEFLEEEATRLESWLSGNKHGKMAYMERWFDKRLDPRLLVPGAKSVVSLLMNYFPAEKQSEGIPKISRYAYGKDYHFIIKEKLKELLSYIKNHIGEVSGRAFVDSAPVLERAWARKSGLGWIGKNANLIHPHEGSWFFLAELIIDLELEPDAGIKDFCGTCTRCMDACPTEAIVSPQVVDGSKCISYFTIELKDELPAAYKDKMQEWVFGCDICQEVCPWNRFASPTREKEFAPYETIMTMTKEEWLDVTEETFNFIYKNSPLKRAGYTGMKKNLGITLPPGERPE